MPAVLCCTTCVAYSWLSAQHQAKKGMPTAIQVTVIAASGLFKKEVFRLPDPFAVIT